jgi:hypothetical protein
VCSVHIEECHYDLIKRFRRPDTENLSLLDHFYYFHSSLFISLVAVSPSSFYPHDK